MIIKGLTKLAQKMRTAAGLGVFVLVWLGPVWLLLGLARLLILTVPLKQMAPFYGADCALPPWVPLADPGQVARARQIRRVIGLAAGYAPWTANCYPQALTARALLGLYGVPYAIYFGVRRSPKDQQVQAHAWVMSGPVAVTGGHSFAAYTTVRMFAAKGAAQPVHQG